MFSIQEIDGKIEVLYDGEPIKLVGENREELYGLVSSILQYLEFAVDHTHIGARSGKWPKVRREFVEQNPCCSACGSVKMLNVHHIEPYSDNPERELDKNNLICLCFSCHFIFGHLKCWTSHNPNVVHDSSWYRTKMQNRPKDLPSS